MLQKGKPERRSVLPVSPFGVTWIDLNIHFRRWQRRKPNRHNVSALLADVQPTVAGQVYNSATNYHRALRQYTIGSQFVKLQAVHFPLK